MVLCEEGHGYHFDKLMGCCECIAVYVRLLWGPHGASVELVMSAIISIAEQL